MTRSEYHVRRGKLIAGAMLTLLAVSCVPDQGTRPALALQLAIVGAYIITVLVALWRARVAERREAEADAWEASKRR